MDNVISASANTTYTTLHAFNLHQFRLLSPLSACRHVVVETNITKWSANVEMQKKKAKNSYSRIRGGNSYADAPGTPLRKRIIHQAMQYVVLWKEFFVPEMTQQILTHEISRYLDFCSRTGKPRFDLHNNCFFWGEVSKYLKLHKSEKVQL